MSSLPTQQNPIRDTYSFDRSARFLGAGPMTSPQTRNYMGSLNPATSTSFQSGAGDEPANPSAFATGLYNNELARQAQQKDQYVNAAFNDYYSKLSPTDRLQHTPSNFGGAAAPVSANDSFTGIPANAGTNGFQAESWSTPRDQANIEAITRQNAAAHFRQGLLLNPAASPQIAQTPQTAGSAQAASPVLSAPSTPAPVMNPQSGPGQPPLDASALVSGPPSSLSPAQAAPAATSPTAPAGAVPGVSPANPNNGASVGAVGGNGVLAAPAPFNPMNIDPLAPYRAQYQQFDQRAQDLRDQYASGLSPVAYDNAMQNRQLIGETVRARNAALENPVTVAGIRAAGAEGVATQQGQNQLGVAQARNAGGLAVQNARNAGNETVAGENNTAKAGLAKSAADAQLQRAQLQQQGQLLTAEIKRVGADKMRANLAISKGLPRPTAHGDPITPAVMQQYGDAFGGDVIAGKTWANINGWKTAK